MKYLRRLRLKDRQKVLFFSTERWDYLKATCLRIRKRNYAYYEKEVYVITNPKVVKDYGKTAVVSFRGNEFWEDTAYLPRDLTVLAGVRPQHIFDSWYRNKIVPRPMFTGLFKNTDIPNFSKWQRCYLYEEVIIILKYLKIVYSRSNHFRKGSPEYHNLNEELRVVREHILKSKDQFYKK